MRPAERAAPLESRTARAWIDDGNVIHVSVCAGAVVGIDDAEEHMAMGRQLAAGRAYTLLLLNIAGMRSITREARVRYSRGGANAEGTGTRAVAIVVDSPLTRAIANFFIGLNRPRTPLRLFNSEAAALTWLRSFAD